jgi:divalent metal cation (Fe/Co/Zn/Cd) transporter
LEADALHFSTDIWSSSVVIVGLFFVLIAEKVLSFLSSTRRMQWQRWGWR